MGYQPDESISRGEKYRCDVYCDPPNRTGPSWWVEFKISHFRGGSMSMSGGELPSADDDEYQ